MGRCGRRLDRLLVLAQALDVTLDDDPPNTIVPAQVIPTPEDHLKVQAALTRTRTVQFQHKSHLIRGKPSTSLAFTVEEATAALESLVEDGCSAAVAEQLIQKGADVNFAKRKSNSLTKRVRKKDQEDIRSNLFETAVQRRDLGVIQVLASRADQASCDGSLGVGIHNGDTNIVRILVGKGANPNLHAAAFRSAVLAGDSDMICALSNGICPLSAELASINLFDAVKSSQVKMIQALLSRGASADLQDPSVLLWAAQSQQWSSIAALCLAKLPPSPEHLSRAIPIVCENMMTISTDVLRATEVLLAAGACGGELAETLTEATRAGQHELVKLLVDYSDFDHSRSPDAIKSAMMAGDLLSFQYLASMSWETSTCDDLLLFLPTTRSTVPLDTRCAMANVVIGESPSKAAISRALLDASENSEVDLVKLLVGAGASVDYEAGKACTVAVMRKSPDLLSALLKGRPSTNTLLRAVRTSEGLPSMVRLVMLELLLNAGAIGPEVDQALQRALEDPTVPRNNYDLIKILVSGGADVNVGEGACLTSAATRSDVKALKLLVTGAVKPTAKVLRVAFMNASCVNPAQVRFDFIRELLRAGARGIYIAKALIEFIDDSQGNSVLFSRLLLEEGDGDINYCHGQSVCRAVAHQHVDLLRLLLKHSPSLVTLSNGLHEAMQINDQGIRSKMCEILLQTGARGIALDEALANATGLSDLALARKLLTAGASTDYNSGLAMRTAIVKDNEDMLTLLVTSSSQPATLSASLLEALTSKKDENRKLLLLRILLKGASRLDGEGLAALLHETFNEPRDLRVLEVFVKEGAAISLEAVRKAIALNHREALGLMMGAFPAQETVRNAFDFAWNATTETRLDLLRITMIERSHRSFVDLSQYLGRAVNEKTPSQPLISFLLHAGALVGYRDSQCLRDTAARLDIQTLGLLLQYSRTKDISAVFEAAINVDQTWLDPSGVTTLSMLLEKGAFGEIVDRGLLLAVERFHTHANAPAIVDLLVTNSASPASSDYRQGFTFEVATRMGDAHLIERLFESQPSEPTVNLAFPYIFKSKADEITILDLIDKFRVYSREHLANALDMNLCHRDSVLQPILFLGMQRWPRSPAILSMLLKGGAFVDQEMEVKIRDVAPAESVTVLLWSLIEQGTVVDEKLTTMLIENGADVNHTTKTTKLTPLLVAVSQSRISIVEMLLLYGADPSSADSSGWTPLRHASARGDLEIMKLLIKSAPTDDGSLQEAVGNLQHAAARLLLDAGHDPNYASISHDMQACLEHLVRRQPVSNDGSALKSMFKLLLNAGANVRYHFDGKSLLIIALDTAHAMIVVPALLSAFMGAVVNEEFNQHRSQGFVYSPASYVIHQKQLSDPAFGRALLKVLRSYGCEDVYYNESGPQPGDYTSRTAPRNIVDREEIRRRRVDQIQAEDEERQRKVAIEDHERQRKLRIEQDDENNRRRLAFEAHETHLTYERERAQASDANMRISTTLRLQLQSKEYAQTQQFALTQQQAELAHTRERNRLQIENVAAENTLRIRSAEAENRLQLSVVDAKVAAERKMYDMAREGRQEQEAVEARGHTRRLQLAKEEEKRLARAASVLKLQAGSQSQRYLTAGDEPD